jgi:hypothetical protein
MKTGIVKRSKLNTVKIHRTNSTIRYKCIQWRMKQYPLLTM